MTTGHLDVDLGTNTLEVLAGTPEADVATGTPGIDVGVPGLTGPRGPAILFVLFGNAGDVPPPAPGQIPFYPRVAGFIIRVTAALSHQTSGATILDVNISGVSIYNDPLQRPILDQVGQHFVDANAIFNAQFDENDYITVDRDAVGTGAKNLIVTVEYEPT